MSDSPGGEDTQPPDAEAIDAQPAEIQPTEEAPPQNQEVKDLQDQFLQQQTMLSQLKEALRHGEEENSSKEKKVEAFASRLSDIKSRTSSRMSASPRTPSSSQQVDETKKTLVGETAIHSKSLSILRQKVSENRAIFEQRGREKTETKKGVEVMIEQLRSQLAAKDDTIRALQENLEASISSRHIIPDVEAVLETDDQIATSKEKIAELSNQVVELQAMVVGLQENLLEKDSVIDARTKAISLMSEDLCRKGKTTLDQLDDTRDEMRHMQHTFATFESDMKREREELVKQLEDKDEIIRQADERNETLKLEGTHLSTLVTDLQTKLLELEQRPSAIAQGQSEDTSQALAEANKQIIKLKAQTKKQVKQINSLKKGTDTTSETVDLHNRIAELEEEKGNLQLHLVDFDELKISEQHLGECVSQLRFEIASLNAQVKQQRDDLATKEDLEMQVVQNLSEIKQLQDDIHQVGEMKVQAELKSVELEESMDNLLREKNNLVEMLTSFQEENKSLIAQSEVASRVEVGLMTASEPSEGLIADLRNQIAMEREHNDELNKLFSSVLGNGSSEDWYKQIKSNQEVLLQLTDSKSEYENVMLKIELVDLQEELEKKKFELKTVKKYQTSCDDKLNETEEHLNVIETIIAQRNAELQHTSSELAQHKKVIATLRAKNKMYDETMNELKSVIAERDSCINEMKSELDVVKDSRQKLEEDIAVEKKLAEDMVQVASDLEQHLIESNATLCHEQATRMEAEANSAQKLASLQEELERLKSLHDQKLADSSVTIAQLNENSASFATQLDMFSNNLRDKEELLQTIEKDLSKAKEQRDMCLVECNSKVAAMFTLLRNRQIKLSNNLKSIAHNHFPEAEQGLDLLLYIDGTHTDVNVENIEEVSIRFDCEIEKVGHLIQCLGDLLDNKTEVVSNLTKQNADLQNEVKNMNDSVIDAEMKFNTAIANHQTELDSTNNCISICNDKINKLESDLTATRIRHLESSSVSNAKIIEMEAIIDSQEAQVAQSTQIINQANQQIADLLRIKDDLEQRIGDLNMELRGERDQIGAMEAAHHEHAESLASYREKLEQKLQASSDEIQRLSSANHAFEQQMAAKEQTLASVSGMLEQSQRDQRIAEETSRNLSNEYSAFQEQCRIDQLNLEASSKKNLEELSELCNNSMKMKLLELEAVLRRTQEETAVSLIAKESEIAEAKQALHVELITKKNLENQLESLVEVSEDKISDLEKKNHNLKTLLTRIEGFKDLCQQDITNIISQSEVQVSQMQGVGTPSVTEAIIVPTMSSAQETVSVDIGDSWQEQSDESWGWGTEEAKLEEQHQAVSQQKTVQDGTNEHLRNQLAAIEAQVKDMEGEKIQMANELRSAQVRSGKLIKKVKELKALNEVMAKKSGDGIGSLDQTMESEFTLTISSLETQVTEVRAERTQTLKENEKMKNKLAALEWKISELTDDNSNISQMINWSAQNINEKERKIAELIVEVGNLTSEIAEQKAYYDKTVNELQCKIVDFNSAEQPNLTTNAAELEELHQMNNDLQNHLKENLLEIQSLSEVRNDLTLKNQAYEELTSLYEENHGNLEDLREDHEELQVAYQRTKTDLESMQEAHKNLSSEYQENKTKLTAVVEELVMWQSQVSSQEMSTQQFSNSVQNQLAQLSEENHRYRDLLSVKESEVNEIRQHLSELEMKCYESVDQQRLELENMKNILSAKETHAVQYVQEISNLRASLSKQTSEIEHLKEDLLHREADIDFVSDQLTQSENKLSDLSDICATKDQDVVKLKSRLDVKDSQLDSVTKELQEHQHIIQLLKSVRESEKSEGGSNVRSPMSAQSDQDKSEDSFVSLDEHNIALYSWHQQDMRVNEMALELMQLVEERDTLQLRLSTSLRTIEELRKLTEGLASGTTTEAVASGSSQSEPGPNHSLGALAIAEGDEQLANKLDQVRSVGRQQRQMALQHHGGVAIDANYTVSRDVQSQSETLIDWIFGKSTPKVQHI